MNVLCLTSVAATVRESCGGYGKGTDAVITAGVLS